MDTVLFRVILVVGFAAYLAAVYLILHIVFARIIKKPDNRALWFFTVVTRPLTLPMRRVLPAGTPEPRIRWVALGVYALLWVVTKVILAQIRTIPPA